MADFFEAGKIPEIRKFAALLRLHRLHGAVFTFQKNALAIRFLQQRKSAPVMPQARELLDEIGFTQSFERREARNFRIGQAHLPWPAAARRATLTFKKNRHADNLSVRQPFVNHRHANILAAFLRAGAGDVGRGDHREIFSRRQPHHDIPHGI